MKQEIWKDITGYKGLYKVSNFGRVYSVLKKIYLKPFTNAGNYLKVSLCKNKKHKDFTIHKLVALAFIEKSTIKLKQINHIDGNVLNNCHTNLEWVTRRENAMHYHNKDYLIGVYYYTDINLYLARMSINKKRIDLGYYKSKYEAHLAYLFAIVFYGIDSKYL